MRDESGYDTQRNRRSRRRHGGDDSIQTMANEEVGSAPGKRVAGQERVYEYLDALG